MSRQFSAFAPANFPMVQAGDNLAQQIAEALTQSPQAASDGDVLVIAQKVVSKAEGCLVALDDVSISAEAEQLASEIDKDPRLVQLILDESTDIVRKRPGVLIVRHRLGFVHANAGIDQSNVAGDDVALLLPKNPDQSAQQLRQELQQLLSVNLRIVISDSFGRPWRHGTCGIAIGASGLPALNDLRGESDLYGREMLVSQQALADELAAAASLLQGQGAEGCPLVLLQGVPIGSGDLGVSSVIRPLEEDLFQ